MSAVHHDENDDPGKRGSNGKSGPLAVEQMSQECARHNQAQQRSAVAFGLGDEKSHSANEFKNPGHDDHLLRGREAPTLIKLNDSRMRLQLG